VKKRMSEIILETRSISKSYGGIKAVDDVSLTVKRASITVLIGPNGSGKSTLFNIISGVDKADGGQVFFMNKEITHLLPHQLFQMGLYRTFQNPRLFFGMSVLENTLLPNNSRGDNPLFALFKRVWQDDELSKAEKAWKALGTFSLVHLYKNRASEISGGQIKLLQLAMMLMVEPTLTLLDEPIAGVAPNLIPIIFSTFQDMRKKGKTLFIIEHTLRELFEIADFVYVMGRGRLIASGTPNEIVKNEKVKEEYLGTSVA